VDLRKIKKLIELAEDAGLAELEVRSGDEAVRITRGAATATLPAPQAPAADPTGAAASAETGPAIAGTDVRAPMAGTFYRAPAPDAEPFVRVGQQVAAGDVLCIIESMKMMNEITAEADGVCASVDCDNGAPVAAGDLLFRLR